MEQKKPATKNIKSSKQTKNKTANAKKNSSNKKKLIKSEIQHGFYCYSTKDEIS